MTGIQGAEAQLNLGRSVPQYLKKPVMQKINASKATAALIFNELGWGHQLIGQLRPGQKMLIFYPFRRILGRHGASLGASGTTKIELGTKKNGAVSYLGLGQYVAPGSYRPNHRGEAPLRYQGPYIHYGFETVTVPQGAREMELWFRASPAADLFGKVGHGQPAYDSKLGQNYRLQVK